MPCIMSVASERIISLSPKAKCEPFKKKVKASHKLLKSVTENKTAAPLIKPGGCSGFFLINCQRWDYKKTQRLRQARFRILSRDLAFRTLLSHNIYPCNHLPLPPIIPQKIRDRFELSIFFMNLRCLIQLFLDSATVSHRRKRQ